MLITNATLFGMRRAGTQRDGGNDNKRLPGMIAGRGAALALVGFLSLFDRWLRGKSRAYARNPRPRPSAPISWSASGASPPITRTKIGSAPSKRRRRSATGLTSSTRARPAGVMMNAADQKELSELFLVGGPTYRADLPRAARRSRGRPRRPRALSPMSTPIRSRRFGSIQKMQVAMARRFTCGAESANQQFNLELSTLSTEPS